MSGMVWDRIHRSVDGNGAVTMTPGYLSERVTLGDDADASSSHLDYPIKSDVTILAVFNADLSADTYVQVEHSVDGSTWIKQGQFETGTPATTDLSKDMAKIAALDDSTQTENTGVMMLYDIDSHGVSTYTRFTVKANGQDESSNHVTFYIIPHF
jgi:hypothetical protein